MSDGPAGRGQTSSPARLGYLLSKYPSANHTYLLREVRTLRRAGVGVVVAAIDGDDRALGSLTNDEREEGATTFVVKSRGAARIAFDHVATLVSRPAGYAAGFAAAVRLARGDLPRLAYNLFYFAEAVVAGRYLRARGCTHVHTHYATNVAVLAARVFGLELSASIHGSAEFIDPVSQRLREKVAACKFVRAISSYGRSQLMLATSPREWDKIEVVRLGVDPGRFPIVEVRPSPSPFRICSVGQLQPAKGYHLLLSAVATLVASGHDLHLTLAGNGPSRWALEEHAVRLGIANRVAFPGAVNHDEVRDIFMESDLFVLPSFAEGIPVVLMEAMASGLACVATRITGIPELIEDGVSGVLVTPADQGELTGAIAHLAGNATVRARIGGAARERVSAAYDLDENVARLVQLFTDRVTAVR